MGRAKSGANCCWGTDKRKVRGRRRGTREGRGAAPENASERMKGLENRDIFLQIVGDVAPAFRSPSEESASWDDAGRGKKMFFRLPVQKKCLKVIRHS